MICHLQIGKYCSPFKSSVIYQKSNTHEINFDRYWEMKQVPMPESPSLQAFCNHNKRKKKVFIFYEAVYKFLFQILLKVFWRLKSFSV